MKGVQKLQVVGDSEIVINWLSQRIPQRNIILKPIYEDISRLLSLFQAINFEHIYNERNQMDNQLSKNGLHVGIGPWH